MANETIELLKNYEPKKMPWPAMHQQKIDGVPVLVLKTAGVCRAYTRQRELVKSIPHILQCCTILLQDGDGVVMELHIAGKPFKEISGLVRRSVPCRDLVGHVFDFSPAGQHSGPWVARRAAFIDRIDHATKFAGCLPADLAVQVLPGVIVNGPDEAQEAHDALMLANPDAEGSVLHSLEKPFQPAKRCWGTQRMKPVPTIDLRIVGFDEAVSEKTGLGLSMVGRVNAEFTTYTDRHAVTEVIGIGPGALTHSERKLLWTLWKQGKFKPRIAEIRYMRDDSYDALRQPTFKQWRPDKHVADTVPG